MYKQMYGYENAIKLFNQIFNESPEKIIVHFTTTASKWFNDDKQQDVMTFSVFKMK